MDTREYLRYIRFKKHLLERIRAMLAEHNVAGFETLSLEYDDLVRLHDDLRMLGRCPHALQEWRLVRLSLT